nr:hypothetical protein [Tanacetum cinerariifolium]
MYKEECEKLTLSCKRSEYQDETGLKLVCYAILMVADPANVGRRVLPMEVVVKCIEEEQEVRPRQEPVAEVVVEAETCPVCLVEMQVGSMASRLPCMHDFMRFVFGIGLRLTVLALLVVTA